MKNTKKKNEMLFFFFFGLFAADGCARVVLGGREEGMECRAEE